jgi:hypothetical protein
LPFVLVLFLYEQMADPDPMPDPGTLEWPIAWAAKEVLRRHLGPKFDRRLPPVPRQGNPGADAADQVAHQQGAA